MKWDEADHKRGIDSLLLSRYGVAEGMMFGVSPSLHKHKAGYMQFQQVGIKIPGEVATTISSHTSISKIRTQGEPTKYDRIQVRGASSAEH